MSGKLRLDLFNKRFGRLVAIKGRIRPSRWLCRCDCGKTKVVSTSYLPAGDTQSCGCLEQETKKANAKFLPRYRGKEHHSYKHGHEINGKSSPTYRTYHNIIDRCENPNNKEYHLYGGRGIKICSRWREDFRNFLSDMGEKSRSKIDVHRKDNNGNYDPNNCCWVNEHCHRILPKGPRRPRFQ